MTHNRDERPAVLAGRSRVCDVCSDPVDPATAHWLHGEGCDRRVNRACACDLVAHPECCPDCAIVPGETK